MPRGTVMVFDPAMCCATGVCGPAVDPSLAQIAGDLQWLAGQGVVVERYSLSQQPDAFVGQARVTGLMQAFGDDALPATLVNGEVLAYGRYPTREELMTALTRKRVRVVASGVPEGGSCEPGSGCC